MTNAPAGQQLRASSAAAASFVPLSSPPQSPKPTGSTSISSSNNDRPAAGSPYSHNNRRSSTPPTSPGPKSPSSNGTVSTAATSTAAGMTSKALDSTAVLANKFVPSSLKALNQSDVSATLAAGKIPSLYSETKKLYDTLIPQGVECMCDTPSPDADGSNTPLIGKHPDRQKMNHEAAMNIRKVPMELRYGLYSSKPLSIGTEGTTNGSSADASSPSPSPSPSPAAAAAAAAEAKLEVDSTDADSKDKSKDADQEEAKAAETKAKKKLEKKIATLTGKADRERYETIVELQSMRDAMLRETKDLKKASEFRDKFEGLLILERDEILRLYEFLSQYKVDVTPFQSPDGPTSFLYAHIRIPGIADVQPALAVGDCCLVRPVEPLQLPSHQKGAQRIYDHSRKSYVPNPIEIQAWVLRIVRGRGGEPDEVVITWLSIEDDSALQHAWSYYPPDRRMYNIRFVPHTLSQERCLTALDWASRLPKAEADSLILAKEEEEELNLPTYRDGHKHDKAVDGKCVDIGQYSLNEKQRAFVSMCISRTIHPSTERVREPMLLTGPAGTGKTRTLYAAINQVLDLDPRNRILVGAPSHTAANVLTERLGDGLSVNELFRLVDTNRGSETIPFPVLKFCRQSKLTGVFTLPPPDELLKFRVIVCTCLDAHLFYRAGLTNATLREWRECFGHSIETLMSQARLSFEGRIRGVKEPHFTHLFIDEAAQATEPESLIPLSVVIDPTPGSIKVEIALVGDPRQLGPQVYSSTAADNGLGCSYLERLLQRPNTQALADAEDKKGGGGGGGGAGAPIDSMEALLAFYNEDKEQSSAFLNMNYRCQPAFLMMPSALFYFDKLQSAKTSATADPEVTSRWCSKVRVLEKKKERVGLEEELAGDVSAGIPETFRPLKQDHWPIHFRGVVGRDVSVALDNFSGTSSWSNVEEAKEVCSIVLTLAQDAVKPEDIGVMAPFRGQVVQIRRLLREAGLGVVNVGTIEDYQAVERDVIVLSLTRSTHKFVEFDVKRRNGVFRQPKRTNVALTRAEHLLVVVGNPNVMAQCPIWRQWLWFCLRNGLWYGNPGSKGHAGLELTDAVVYSTTRPMGDAIDNDIITVGTLERISRKTQENDPDSLDDLIAKGIYTTRSKKNDVDALTDRPSDKKGPPSNPHVGSLQPPQLGQPSLYGPASSIMGPQTQASGPAPNTSMMGPQAQASASGMGSQPQPADGSAAPAPQPVKYTTRTPLFGPGSGIGPGAGMGRGPAPSIGQPVPGPSAGQPIQSYTTRTPLFGPGAMGRGGPPPQQHMTRTPLFGPGGMGMGMGRGGYPPPQYYQGGMPPPPGHPGMMGPPGMMGAPRPGYMEPPPNGQMRPPHGQMQQYPPGMSNSMPANHPPGSPNGYNSGGMNRPPGF